ncbi:hypothetical protein EXIGLDRAFT_303791 [Exidia glandulosa HHB12029]|uniref:F-box domain-containing protein n=1 Tax=Exidia glandulosa HHB12029 TaxID=1314781 RepID=A0A165ZLR4_EXIGL|nr:hypothetical protein EXIGLDRAFT_303791 [Exidia glandulosa HHB12029]
MAMASVGPMWLADGARQSRARISFLLYPCLCPRTMSGPSFEAAAALRVPYDVLEHVAEFADQASLAALCRVSHEVSSLATRQLYRYVDLTTRSDQATLAFLELIAHKQSLGKLVVSLSIGPLRYAMRQAAYPTAFVVALRQMPMLRHLDSHDIELVGGSVTEVLRGLTRLESCHFAYFDGPAPSAADVFDCLPPLKRLHMDRHRIVRFAVAPRLDLRLVELLLLRSADTLVSLAILNGNFDLGGFLADTGPGAVWPHLISSLHIHSPTWNNCRSTTTNPGAVPSSHCLTHSLASWPFQVIRPQSSSPSSRGSLLSP